MLQNFTNATFRWASAGFKIADDETLAKRQAICDTCQYWKASARLGMGKCLKCGCSLAKLKLASEKCPIEKWSKRAFRDSERLFLYLVVMKFYFLLRYAAKANANAPKIAAYVAGSGTLIEMDKSFPLTA